jgi:3-methyl-2-oxobutanoate hydroxymethyltransferase
MAVPGSALRRTALASSLLKTRAPFLRTQTTSLLTHRPVPCSATLLPLSQTRHSSYSGPLKEHGKARKKVTIQTLQNLYKKGEPIAMLTAHDYPSAHVADASGMDMVLVGDSLGMVALGLDNTTEVVMEEMILHCRSVVRAAKSAFIVSLAL